MSDFWMVRAGEGGYLFEEFRDRSVVAIGFNEMGDLTDAETLDGIRARLRQAYPDLSQGKLGVWAGMVHRFRALMEVGDEVLTYDPSSREYLIGHVVGGYEYNPSLVTDCAHIRRVRWSPAPIPRDGLSVGARGILGAIQTLFKPGEDVLREMHSLQGRAPHSAAADEEEAAVAAYIQIREEQLSRAFEFIKDRVVGLSAEEMEQLIAHLLRAMGYKARVTPKGPDRGRDVIASPDGLGLEAPRIIAEVKHRKGAMGAIEVRGFLGGLRDGDRGLFVSTGGFTREAKYEADRSKVPITLIDLDDLVRLITESYEDFELEGRALVPLEKVYWPLP